MSTPQRPPTAEEIRAFDEDEGRQLAAKLAQVSGDEPPAAPAAPEAPPLPVVVAVTRTALVTAAGHLACAVSRIPKSADDARAEAARALEWIRRILAAPAPICAGCGGRFILETECADCRAARERLGR